MMTMYRKVCLKPNKVQAAKLLHYADSYRFLHNEMFALRQNRYNAERRNTTVAECITHINNLNLPFLSDIPASLISCCANQLQAKYEQFFRVRNKSVHPDYWKKSLCKPLFEFSSLDIEQPDEKHITLAGITGAIKCNKFTLNAVVSHPHIYFTDGHWYLVYAYQVEKPDLRPDTRQRVGIDLGIRTFAQCSDLTCYPSINKSPAVLRLEEELYAISLQITNKYRYNGGVRSRAVEKLIYKMTKLITKLHNIRANFLHTVTRQLTRTTADSFVIEDLNISDMLLNEELAEAIRAQEFDRFRYLLTYKCDLYGIRLIVADRYYPSSKRCCNCGHIVHRLPLSMRVFTCPVCNFSTDRDVNAAINLKNYTPDWNAVG